MPESGKQKIDAKVVHLEPESQRIIRARLASLPSPVQHVHEKGKLLSLNLLTGFFDRADDSLFELADKAQSNEEQNLYFDSMREVRVQRRGIEKRFAEAIDLAFAELANAAPISSTPSSENYSADTLSLVDYDELEEIVAVDATVGRANNEQGEAIQLISLRLDSLLPVKVFQKNNPFGPDVLCNAFMGEVKKLDVGLKAKLVLFKLFERAVIAKMGSVYRQVNEILKSSNVLPSLSATSGHSARSSEAPRSPHIPPTSIPPHEAPRHVTSETPAVSPEVLSTLKKLLGDKVVANAAPQSQTQKAASELLSLLSQAQHMPTVMEGEVALNVKALLNQLQQQTGANTNIGQLDDQVMNLVNMLFDFILEDRNLAAPMKALISRMQIPIIKVAIADKSFFTKGGHVARRLLNEMATAAVGWSGDSETCGKDPLYKKIDFIVRKLIEEFESDLSIFSELLADFSGFLEKEKRRAAVLEQRTIDAEDGKAKAEIARTTVALEIELRTEGRDLPKVVQHLIRDAWNNVLFVTALKYGYQSSEWESHLSALEELVWSVQPPRSKEERQKLIRLVPSLLKKLRAGLDAISYNPFEMSDIFKSLEKVHLACIRGQMEKRRPAKPKAEAQAKAPVQAPVNTAQKQSAKPSAPVSTPEHKAPSVPQGTASPQAGGKNVGIPEPTLNDLARGMELNEIEEPQLSTSKTARPSGPTPLAEDDPHMKMVKSFVQGAWFDMVDDKGERIRCRLATYIKPTGKYIFVNRNGMKVAEKTRQDLAWALKENTLSALDNSMLFDRALETVVSGLRKT